MNRQIPGPRRIVDAVNPAALTDAIPARVNLRQNAPPFDGELREEQTGALTIAPGQRAVIATLRRPWSFVGFAVDPGNAGAPGVNAILRVMNARFPAAFASVVIAPGTALALPAQIVCARAELVIENPTLGPVQVRGAIWGMSDK